MSYFTVSVPSINRNQESNFISSKEATVEEQMQSEQQEVVEGSDNRNFYLKGKSPLSFLCLRYFLFGTLSSETAEYISCSQKKKSESESDIGHSKVSIIIHWSSGHFYQDFKDIQAK